MIDKPRYWLKIGAILSAASVLLMYLVCQPEMTQSLSHFQYFDLLGFFALTTGILYWRIRATSSIGWRGIYWPLLILGAIVPILVLYEIKHGVLLVSLPMGLSYILLFSIGLFAFLYVLSLSARSFGHLILKSLNLEGKQLSLFQIALGLGIQIFLLTILGLLGQFKAAPVVTLLLLPIGISFRECLKWSKSILFERRAIKTPDFISLLLFAALVMVISVAWIFGLAPLPQGNDGLSMYMAIPHTITDTHQLVRGHWAYGWSVYMALGETIFDNQTYSLVLSHAPGYLCLIACYQFFKPWVNFKWRLAILLLLFTMPFFAFHMVSDEKVDLALLFFGIAILDVIIHQKIKLKDAKAKLSYGLVLGLLFGSMMAIKYTTVFFLLGVAPILLFSKSPKKQVGFFLLLFGGVYLLVTQVMEASTELDLFTLLFIGSISTTGLVLMFFDQKWPQWRHTLMMSTVMIIAGIFILGPWMLKNGSEHPSWSVTSVLKGYKAPIPFYTHPDYFKSKLEPKEARPEQMSLPQDSDFQAHHSDAEYNVKPAPTRFKKSANHSDFNQREVQRYLGFEKGIWPYLSLPLDLTTTWNIPGNRYVDIGFLFLLIGILTLGLKFRKRRLVLFIACLGCFYLLNLQSLGENYSSLASDRLHIVDQILNQHPETIQPIFNFLGEVFIQKPYAVSHWLSPIYELGSLPSKGISLLFIVSPLLAWWLLVYNQRNSKPTSRHTLITYYFFTGLTWWLLGSGIVWYGMMFFALLTGSTIQWIYEKNGPLKDFVVSALTIQLILFVMLFMTNPRINAESQPLFLPQNIQYATSPRVNEKSMPGLSETHKQIVETINLDQTSLVYGVNTNLKYFIQHSNERLYEDNFLSRFDRSQKEYGSDFDMVQCLRDNQFKYVLINLNMHTLDRTQGQELRNRISQLVLSLEESPNAKLLYTDNLVYPSNPSSASQPLPGVEGRLAKPGSVILYQVQSSP